jgi:hypothetical protein
MVVVTLAELAQPQRSRCATTRARRFPRAVDYGYVGPVRAAERAQREERGGGIE